MNGDVVRSEKSLPAKRFIGQFVCYGEEDGSFSWGRIVDEGFVNTPEGEKEVFILSDRMTCRVPKSDLEMQSVQAVSRRIGSGNTRMGLPPKPEPRKLPEKTETTKALIGREPELDGIVPALEDIMGIQRSEGLPMSQMVKTITSSQDPSRKITFVFRRYGYNTNVRKERLNLKTDIVDRKYSGMEDLDDDQLFLFVMGRRMGMLALNQGMRNMLSAGEAISVGGESMAERMRGGAERQAIDLMKNRIAEKEAIEAEVVSKHVEGA